MIKAADKYFFEKLSNAIILLDDNFKILFANENALSIFNISLKALENSNFFDVFIDNEALIKALQGMDFNLQKKQLLDINITIKPNCHLTNIDLTISSWQGCKEDNSLILLTFHHRNKSNFQNFCEQIYDYDHLRKVEKLLSHEIKNPLAAIKGAAQYLKSEYNIDDTDLLDLIVSESNRIERFLEVISGKKQAYNFKTFNLHEVLFDIKQLLHSMNIEHVQIAEEYDPSLPYIYADKDSLFLAIMNIVKNAIDALNETELAQITLRSYWDISGISYESDDEKIRLPICIEVENNGPPIAKGLHKNIFTPFVSNKENGSGIGLALTAAVIKDHKGIISLHSNEAATKFSIYLPSSL